MEHMEHGQKTDFQMSLLKKLKTGTIDERLPDSPAEKKSQRENSSQEKNERAATAASDDAVPASPCILCGDAMHWRDIAGVWRCAHCYRVVEALCTAIVDVLADADGPAARAADVIRDPAMLDDPWASDEPGRLPAVVRPAAACRCGSLLTNNVAIHAGDSLRVDCGACGRFLRWGVWHGVTCDAARE